MTIGYDPHSLMFTAGGVKFPRHAPGPIYIPPEYERRADLYPDPTPAERAAAQMRGLRTLRRTSGLSFVGGRWEWDHEQTITRGEPDRCIVRAYVGHLCGYVRVPDDHPWVRADIMTSDTDVEIHGGVTWQGAAAWCGPGYWIGFDCGHSGDLSPGTLHEPEGVRERFDVWERATQICERVRFLPVYDHEPPTPWAQYRTIEYVRAEVDRLADQMVAAAGRVDAEDGSDA